MVDSQAEMQDDYENRPQIGSVGFILNSRSLCVYTQFGWIEVEVCLLLRDLP